MPDDKFIIITTVNQPTEGIKKIAEYKKDWVLIIVADKKTPDNWCCNNTHFISVTDQIQFGSEYVRHCPWNNYARKNIGYLSAIQNGAKVIAETDDDNIPKQNFLNSVTQRIEGSLIKKTGWVNVYTYFTDQKIWPRGFPLEYINESFKEKSKPDEKEVFDCPIQQFLVDGNPDVDAVYRLTKNIETKFNSNTIILSGRTFCPFNSQNTVWFKQAFPLLYLPGYVNFRMTDIWRSFIAQICLYKTGKQIAFRHSTMIQRRNQHSLIHDFKDEIPGYLNNVKIMELLDKLTLSAQPDKIGENMYICYEKLVQQDIIPEAEMNLVRLWLDDIDQATKCYERNIQNMSAEKAALKI